jgi:hypothetical protein
MDVFFERVETGRTHSTKDGIVPIRDEAGNPEAEYRLGGIVDGVKVPFLTKSAGYVEQLVERGKESQTADGEPEHGANVPPEAKPEASWAE